MKKWFLVSFWKWEKVGEVRWAGETYPPSSQGGRTNTRQQMLCRRNNNTASSMSWPFLKRENCKRNIIQSDFSFGIFLQFEGFMLIWLWLHWDPSLGCLVGINFSNKLLLWQNQWEKSIEVGKYEIWNESSLSQTPKHSIQILTWMCSMCHMLVSNTKHSDNRYISTCGSWTTDFFWLWTLSSETCSIYKSKPVQK